MKTSNGVSNQIVGLKSSYRGVLWLGGLMCMILIAYSLATMLIVAFIGGPPQSATEAFAMLSENRLFGLLRLDILTVLIMPVYYILFYGMYLALKKANEEWVTIFTILIFAGLTLFLATPSALSYLYLSDTYTVAATQFQKDQLLAAGEAVVAADLWHGTGAVLGGILLQTGTLFISIIMLKSRVFSKLTAWVGIVMHGLDLLHIVIGFFLPAAGVMMMAVAGPLYLLWFPLVGARLFKLSKKC